MDNLRNILLIILTVIIFSILFISHDLYAFQKKRVAVLNFVGKKVSNEFAEVVRDILEVNLYKTQAFEIIERNQIHVILKEQGFEETGCIETDCAVKIGKLLSVDLVLIGSVSKTNKYIIVIKFVNIREGRLEYADSEFSDDENSIEKALINLANKAAQIAYENTGNKDTEGNKSAYRPAEKTFAEYYNQYYRGAVPGWWQYNRGDKIKGPIFAGAFLLAGSYFIYSYYDYYTKEKEYEELSSNAPKSEHDRKYDESRAAYTRSNIALGAFAGAYLLNWIDILFFSKSVDEKSSTKTTGNNYFKYYVHREYTNMPGIFIGSSAGIMF